MADSIRDDTFWASKCGSFDEIDDEKCVGNSENQKMGGEPGNFNKGVTGVFYLETKGEVPFSKGPRKNKEGSNRLPFYQITQILFNVVF